MNEPLLKIQNLQIDLQIIPIVPEEHFKINYPDVLSALGGLYVLEGSMLGGVMIKKHLTEKLQNESFVPFRSVF